VKTPEILAGLRSALSESLRVDAMVSIEFPPLVVHASWVPPGKENRRHAVCRVDNAFFDGTDEDHRTFIGDCVIAIIMQEQQPNG
jgi:hypothetical protein